MAGISTPALGNVTATLGEVDIQIGALEIKNSTDDTRATVGANGLHVDVKNIQAGDNNIGNVDVVTMPTVAVTGTFWQATQPVSLASVPSHAVTNAGTFAVQVDGDALTALQLIDDVIYVDDADWTDSTSKHALVGGLYQSSPQTVTDGDVAPFEIDVNGNLKITLGTLLAGEDLTNDVLKSEQRFSYNAVITADAQIKSGAGFLHAITFAPNDATPTAGTIIVYDNTAESGTQIFNWNVQATAFIPFTLVFDCSFSTGLYIGFTTTADVNVSVSYR